MNLNLNKKTSLLIFSFFLFVILIVGCVPSGLVGLVPTNQTPIITSTPIITATMGAAYTYNVTATDPDGGTLTYFLVSSPAGMTINSSTGLITWTPTAAGNYNVEVRVSDGALFATQIYIITVAESGAYPTGGTGPAGGHIFYDKGSYSNGWRYLEAASVSTEWTTGKEWSSDATLIGGTETGIGTGQSNTTLIVAWLNSHGETDRAAQLCNALTQGGYSDWFLPSKDELNLMFTNLHNIVTPVGDFADTWYWSSSEYDAISAWTQYFADSYQLAGSKNDPNRVRAVRAF